MAREAPPRDNVAYVKLKGTKKNETPEFIFKEKVDGQKTESKSTFLSGVIKKIEPTKYEWPEDSGKWVYGFKIEMQDENHKYLVGLSYTWMSRGILNCLANNELSGEVSFEVEPCEPGGDGYPKCWVNVGDQTCKWKWKFKELSAMVDYSTDTGDYTKLNEFLDNVIIEEISPKYEEWYNRMSKDGNFATAQEEEEDPILEEVKKNQEEEANDSEEIPQHEGTNAYDPENAAPPQEEEPAPVEEENDDLPF